MAHFIKVSITVYVFSMFCYSVWYFLQVLDIANLNPNGEWLGSLFYLPHGSRVLMFCFFRYYSVPSLYLAEVTCPVLVGPNEYVDGWNVAAIGSVLSVVIAVELIKWSKAANGTFSFFRPINFKNYKFDPSVIRGLEYYTGPIFEVNLNFEVKNSKGQKIQFGSIGGGGRYDNLVNNFGNLDCPATGISIGLDRLVFALMQKKDFKFKSTRPIVICVFDKNNTKQYVEILNKLREANISSEIYPGEGKLKKQMEYANKIQSPGVIFYGDDEIKKAEVKFRNLKTGEEISVKIENLANEIKKFI